MMLMIMVMMHITLVIIHMVMMHMMVIMHMIIAHNNGNYAHDDNGNVHIMVLVIIKWCT